MSVNQWAFKRRSMGRTEGYLSDLVHNYVDNKYAAKDEKIPFGYPVMTADSGYSKLNSDLWDRHNGLDGQAVKLGVDYPPIGKLNATLAANATSMVVKEQNHPLRSGDIVFIGDETILVKGCTAATSTTFTYDIANVGNVTRTALTVDGNTEQEIYLKNGPVSFAGIALLDPRLPAVINHSEDENKIPGGKAVSSLWFGDVNVRVATAVKAGQQATCVLPGAKKGDELVFQPTVDRVVTPLKPQGRVELHHASFYHYHFSGEEPDRYRVKLPGCHFRTNTAAGKVAILRVWAPAS